MATRKTTTKSSAQGVNPQASKDTTSSTTSRAKPVPKPKPSTAAAGLSEAEKAKVNSDHDAYVDHALNDPDEGAIPRQADGTVSTGAVGAIPDTGFERVDQRPR